MVVGQKTQGQCWEVRLSECWRQLVEDFECSVKGFGCYHVSHRKDQCGVLILSTFLFFLALSVFLAFIAQLHPDSKCLLSPGPPGSNR